MAEITPEQLEEWRRLCEVAAPPPWIPWIEGPEEYYFSRGYISLRDSDDNEVCPLSLTETESTGNASFIAAARIAMPLLIARVEELEKAQEHMVHLVEDVILLENELKAKDERRKGGIP